MYPFNQAVDAAEMFRSNTAYWSERTAITGSLRRIMSFADSGGSVSADWRIGRVEICAIPKVRTYDRIIAHTLFGDTTEPTTENMLDARIYELGYEFKHVSDARTDLWIPVPGLLVWIPCTLYLTTEAEWAACVALTTGPQEFIDRLRPEEQGGILRDTVSINGWTATEFFKPVECANEGEFFEKVIGMEWVPPHLRIFIGTPEESKHVI